jgi:adenylate cyclase
MQWRCQIGAEKREARARGDIKLLAIGSESQDRIGRYGQGAWLSREPFLEQLAFFSEWCRPTVIGYDILFQDAQGWQPLVEESGVVSSTSPREVTAAIGRLSDEGKPLSLPVIRRLNRIAAEQGDLYLAHSLATVRERIPVVVGFNLRGSWVDPQAVEIESWSDRDVFGDDPTGNEDRGHRVPYLRDMAIPESDLRSVPAQPPNAQIAWNANLPARSLLDYVNMGFLNAPRDDDNVIRTVPTLLWVGYTNRVTGRCGRFLVPSFALTCVLTHLGVEFPLKPGVVQVDWGREIRISPPGGPPLRVPIDAFGRLYLNYDVLFKDFGSVELWRFVGIPGGEVGKQYADKVKKEISLDKSLVMVGVTATGVDVGACPVAPNIPLVFVHMVAANNILNQDFLAPLPPAARDGLLAGLAILVTILCLLVRGSNVAAGLAGLSVVYLLTAWLGVQLGAFILPVMTPIVYLSLVSVSVLSWRYFVEERDRKRVRGMFSTMVSGSVLRFLEEHPGSFSLRGHAADATILFTDISGFTNLSEKLPPDELVAVLNAYFTPISNCIIDTDGYIDKYTGDGIMAVWGAPYADPEHAFKACVSALRQRSLLCDVNRGVKAQFGVELLVRIGINSGPVTAGNMGSERKFQYTVVGDAVNLSARLEPFNKDFGTDIIVGPVTRARLQDRLVTRPLCRVAVHGKEEYVEISELVGFRGSVPASRMEAIAAYAAALDAFRRRDWDGCAEKLRSGPSMDDPPSRTLLRMAERCAADPSLAERTFEYARASKQ